MNLHRTISLGVLLLVLTACAMPPAVEPSASLPPATASVTATPEPLATPALSPTPLPERSLVICAGSFPVDLFLYSEPTYIKQVLLAAIYDGPIEISSHYYRPVILTKLPSLADGDAWIEAVEVQEGALVMDDGGALTVLAPGVIVRPAGCRSGDCAVAYESGTIQMDRLRALFNIVPGIQWADGMPLTAADSVFSYRVASSEEVLYGNAGLLTNSAASFTYTADYSAVDTNTVQWTGLPGFLDPNYPFNFFSPLPEHQLGEVPITALLEMDEVLYSPLGWGPYRVTSWVTGEGLTLEPNPNYYRADEGLPYFERIEVRTIGQDPATSLLAFQAGECDLLLQDTLPGVSVGDLQFVADVTEAHLFANLQPVFEHLTFNLAPADPQQPAFFADPRMRQAAALCIDRPALVEPAYSGLVPALDMALPLDHPLLLGAPAGLFQHDPQSGRDLLEEMGWRDTNEDGLREAHGVEGISDDTPLILRLAMPDSELRSTVGGLIAGQLQECGFNVVLEPVPGRDLFAQNADSPAAGRRFDLLEMSSPMDMDGLCALAETSRISGEANAWSGSNLAGFSLPAMDEACSLVRASLPGTAEYITSRQSVLQLLNETIPVLPLFVYANFSVARSDLTGLTTGLGQSELQDLELFRLQP